jgi:hypothetical protein
VPAAFSDATTANHSRIIAVSSGAYGFSKQYPWAQALFDFDETRPAVVVQTIEPGMVNHPRLASHL